jgi:hypothetical protein
MARCGTADRRRIVETIANLTTDANITRATEAIFAQRLVLTRRHGPRRHFIRYYMSWYWRITRETGGNLTIERTRSVRDLIPKDGSARYPWTLRAHVKCPVCLARL